MSGLGQKWGRFSAHRAGNQYFCAFEGSLGQTIETIHTTELGKVSVLKRRGQAWLCLSISAMMLTSTLFQVFWLQSKQNPVSQNSRLRYVVPTPPADLNADFRRRAEIRLIWGSRCQGNNRPLDRLGSLIARVSQENPLDICWVLDHDFLQSILPN